MVQVGRLLRMPQASWAHYAYGVWVSEMIAAWAALEPQTNEERPLTLEAVGKVSSHVRGRFRPVRVGITHAQLNVVVLIMHPV